MKHKRLMLLGVIAIALLALIGLAAMAVVMSQQDMKQNNPYDNKVTLKGQTACLPHKNNDLPHTLECAAGLKVDKVYYALKYANNQAIDVPQGDVIVTGKYATPSTDERYAIVGTVEVTSITKQ